MMLNVVILSRGITLMLTMSNWWIRAEDAITNGPPRISTDYERRQIVRAGDRLRLDCPVESRHHEAIYEWTKDGQTIHVGWQRFRVLRLGVLYVRDLELDDTGVYQCTATNGFGTAEARYLVYVSPNVNSTLLPTADFDENYFQEYHAKGEPPVFLRLDQMIRDSHVTQAPGSTVRLRCRAGGRPRPEVLWFKDGKMIAEEDERVRHGEERWILRLARVKVEDSGSYTCRAFNKAGTINFTYDVEVIDYPDHDPIFLPPYPSNQSVSEGNPVTFSCLIQSPVEPHVQWLKRLDSSHRQGDLQSSSSSSSSSVNASSATFLINDDPYVVLRWGQFSTHPPSDGHFATRLTIHRTTLADAGQYACAALSRGGFSLRSAYLTVMPSVTLPQQPDRIETLFPPVIFVAVVIISCVVVVIVGAVLVTYWRLRRRSKYRRTPHQCTPLIGSLLPPPPPPCKALSAEGHYEHHYAVLDSNPVLNLSGCTYQELDCDRIVVKDGWLRAKKMKTLTQDSKALIESCPSASKQDRSGSKQDRSGSKQDRSGSSNEEQIVNCYEKC